MTRSCCISGLPPARGCRVDSLTMATQIGFLIRAKERGVRPEIPAESQTEMASGGILPVAIVSSMRYVNKKITTEKNRPARHAAGAPHPVHGDGDLYGYDVLVEMLQLADNGIRNQTGRIGRVLPATCSIDRMFPGISMCSLEVARILFLRLRKLRRSVVFRTPALGKVTHTHVFKAA